MENLIIIFVILVGILSVESLPLLDLINNFHLDVTDELENRLLEHIGVTGQNLSPRILREDIDIPVEAQEKYSSLLHKHRQRRGIVAKGIKKIAGIPGVVSFANQSRQHFTFRMLDRVPLDSEIIIAELKLYKDSPNRINFFQHSTNRTHRHPIGARVSVRYLPDDVTDSLDSQLVLDDRLITANSSGWKVFDVTEAVHRWLDRPTSRFNLRLHVDPVRPGRHAKVIADEVHFGTETESQNAKALPVLTLYTVKYVPKDEPTDCAEESSPETQRCCRVPKYVDIRNMQWANRWIIEPRGFEAYECLGTCGNQPQRTSTSDRSSLPWFFRPDRNYRTCGSSKTAPLPIMYLVQKNGATEIRVEEIPQMITEECSCLR